MYLTIQEIGQTKEDGSPQSLLAHCRSGPHIWECKIQASAHRGQETIDADNYKQMQNN
jgi:hypothetical protein